MACLSKRLCAAFVSAMQYFIQYENHFTQGDAATDKPVASVVRLQARYYGASTRRWWKRETRERSWKSHKTCRTTGHNTPQSKTQPQAISQRHVTLSCWHHVRSIYHGL